MNKTLILFIGLCVLVSCSKKKTPEEAAKNLNEAIMALDFDRGQSSFANKSSIGNSYNNYVEYSTFVWGLKTDGYGLGPDFVPSTKEFIAESIELPKTGKNRIIVAEKYLDGKIVVVDDFIISEEESIFSATYKDNSITYSTRGNNSFRIIELKK